MAVRLKMAESTVETMAVQMVLSSAGQRAMMMVASWVEMMSVMMAGLKAVKMAVTMAVSLAKSMVEMVVVRR